MEKNDIQSGGQDPVPQQLFGSLIYSAGHLVHTAAHPNPIPKTWGGRGGEINHWANVIGQPSVTFLHRPHNT